MLPDSFNLSLLHYGHSGPFVRRLTDRFDATKMTEAVRATPLDRHRRARVSAPDTDRNSHP